MADSLCIMCMYLLLTLNAFILFSEIWQFRLPWSRWLPCTRQSFCIYLSVVIHFHLLLFLRPSISQVLISYAAVTYTAKIPALHVLCRLAVALLHRPSFLGLDWGNTPDQRPTILMAEGKGNSRRVWWRRGLCSEVHTSLYSHAIDQRNTHRRVWQDWDVEYAPPPGRCGKEGPSMKGSSREEQWMSWTNKIFY